MVLSHASLGTVDPLFAVLHLLTPNTRKSLEIKTYNQWLIP